MATLSGVGSSPLTRGKPGKLCTEKVAQGLIPAHAGKTTDINRGSINKRAHPRSRGENLRTREIIVKVTWLIPAHAGKTARELNPALYSPAHPRSRGENIVATRSNQTERGSSPLTRGKQRPLRAYAPGPGLIPAHAGKTLNPALVRTRIWAHPRSRGENVPAS